MLIENRASNGYIAIENIDGDELVAVLKYCAKNSLKYYWYREYQMMTIGLWRSRPFTATGDFAKNGFIGKAQKHACETLGAQVMADLARIQEGGLHNSPASPNNEPCP
jgi:hypothetical protein